MVGVVPKMAESEPRTRARQPGGTPQRAETIRQREEAGEESAAEADERWHVKHNVPCVAQGDTFVLGGMSFCRTGRRGAVCVACSHPFGTHSYNERALLAHAQKCQTRAAQAAAKAAADAETWTGEHSASDYQHDIKNFKAKLASSRPRRA